MDLVEGFKAASEHIIKERYDLSLLRPKQHQSFKAIIGELDVPGTPLFCDRCGQPAKTLLKLKGRPVQPEYLGTSDSTKQGHHQKRQQLSVVIRGCPQDQRRLLWTVDLKL